MKQKHLYKLKFLSNLKCFLLLFAFTLAYQILKNCTIKNNFISIISLTDNFKVHKQFSIVESYFPLVEEFMLKKSKRFTNEAARKIGFRVKSHKNITDKNNEKKVIFLATSYFNEWNPKHYYFLQFGNETFQRYQCPIYNCYATKNLDAKASADAVLFHIRDLEVFSMAGLRNPNQIWILYSMEPPWLEIKDLRRFDGIFNWTMSYRRNSDVPLSYGFIGKRMNSQSKHKFYKNVLGTKQNKAVWFVSNCRTDSNREEYIERLQKVYPVDVFGGCGSEACRPAESRKCYIEIAKHYKFYLSFENAVCRDYVTEKLFNALEYNIIPVTLGGANYSKLIPENSTVNAMDFKTPEELGSYLWDISRNDKKYLSYFKWKKYFRSYLQPWMCDLCEKLHEKSVPQIKYNLDEWWHEGHSCLRWSKNGFLPVKKYAFPIYHTKLFN